MTPESKGIVLALAVASPLVLAAVIVCGPRALVLPLVGLLLPLVAVLVARREGGRG